MKRREVIQALLTPDAAETLQPAQPPARVASNAVRAMGLEVGRLAAEAREAEELRRQLSAGVSVVELSPEQVDPSFVSDRLARTGDTAYRELVQSIKEEGQQLPILVRPHPTEAGRYQVAYGHRRRHAALELGIPVKAIVREMTDAELVVAQGKENSERRDLSFVERALFAANLQQRNFSRATINSALGTQSPETTRLLQVVASIPEDLIHKIGPAPRAGRLRWMELARELDRPGVLDAIRAFLETPSSTALSSDGRFDAVIGLLRVHTRPAQDSASTIDNARGEPAIRIERSGAAVKLTIDERAFPGLSELVIQELRNLLLHLPSEGGRSGNERRGS